MKACLLAIGFFLKYFILFLLYLSIYATRMID